MEDIKANHFLQFISTKHKIPLETLNKAPKLQIGYVIFNLFRKRPTSGRSPNIRSTLITFPPSDSTSTTRTKLTKLERIWN